MSARHRLPKTPRVGIAALATMLACAPTVLLAIVSAVSNVASNAAIASAVAIQFWLYVHWSAGGIMLSHCTTSGFTALAWSSNRLLAQANQRGAWLFLALVANTMQFVAGPLLQQSTHRAIEDRTSDEFVLDLAPTNPDGWFGTTGNASAKIPAI
ncbi:hypothetical protein B0T14DRAFT_497783 [Immersiella caudata]|uniref:Uncharacterized protein n=1 Tax=Immersiella caudata TaxID=314043 RepID=A0AA39WJL1_9PEZI|nr:hypothetical protein B0T14DRAFT_497783 [Immersiella caudata]